MRLVKVNMLKKNSKPKLLVLLLLSLCFSKGYAQKISRKVEYSDPVAPVGNASLTVPSSVKPILDTWMRDTYVMYGPDGFYYMTGTTASPERTFPEGRVHCWDYNDGIYLWRSADMKTWVSMGRIWSFDKDAAAWQKKGKPVKPGSRSLNGDPLDSIYRAVWAPELHYIKSQKKWLIAACLNGDGGSFVLESISGKPEGPYRNIKANAAQCIFEGIDLSIFEDDNGSVYLLGHNHYIARMDPSLNKLAEPFKELVETPYNPEPYIEGVFMAKYNGRYQLLQTVWSLPDGKGRFTYLPGDSKKKELYSYDVVVSESKNIYGPYGPRYPAILEGGHNNIFKDKEGNWWSTTFFNPRGTMGTRFPVTCRPALVPVKWEGGRLRPDEKRAGEFYTSISEK